MVIWINFLHHVRDPRTVLDSGFHAVNSRFQVLDSRLRISRTWIQDCNRWWLSRLLELYSGCQSPKSGFHKQKNPGFWILQLNLSWVPDSLTRGKVSNVPNSDLFFFEVSCTSALRRKIYTKPHLYQNLFSTYVFTKYCPATSFPCRKIELKNHPYRQETVLEFCVRFASIKLNEVLHSSNKYQPLDMYQYYVILCTTIHGYFQMHKM